MTICVAIVLKAAKSPAGTMRADTRFAVRIWIADDSKAKMVASIYNTRGDKVNDTAAKYAWQQTPEQRLARKLMEKSIHLGQDNVEVLTNTVSASSHKLVAFNTLAHTVLSNNARTLEDLVKEMLRPMLKSWLDDNLPVLVERIVKAEIERVSRGR